MLQEKSAGDDRPIQIHGQSHPKSEIEGASGHKDEAPQKQTHRVLRHVACQLC